MYVLLTLKQDFVGLKRHRKTYKSCKFCGDLFVLNFTEHKSWKIMISIVTTKITNFVSFAMNAILTLQQDFLEHMRHRNFYKNCKFCGDSFVLIFTEHIWKIMISIVTTKITNFVSFAMNAILTLQQDFLEHMRHRNFYKNCKFCGDSFVLIFTEHIWKFMITIVYTI